MLREQLYLRLVPDALLAHCAIDRRTLRTAAGEHGVHITAPAGAPWARVEVRPRDDDRDPALLLDIGMSPFGVPEPSFVQVVDPAAPRYNIDRDEEGQDTLLGTAGRNLAEERRALADGLAPGQLRRGLRMLGPVLQAMDAFCLLLGRDFYLVEPLFYHSALLYERQGCDYFIGRDRMDAIHAGFQPGGELRRRLDGASPFRHAGHAATVRGRSWAIHDGILEGAVMDGWTDVKMYRVPGRPAAVSTFPGGTY
ncbi:MAG: hypothetical protein HY216_15900 [Candidatus Rokubacteria bacterium]|nr:hypothetical protein [Candidatus Rokubacteria bacterium]